jgi:hypothetical protein
MLYIEEARLMYIEQLWSKNWQAKWKYSKRKYFSATLCSGSCSSHYSGPRFDPGQSHVGFVVDIVAIGEFFPSTSVSPAKSHSTESSAILNNPVFDASQWGTASVVK